MKNVGELHNQFVGCNTFQKVSARIAAMENPEIRELMTLFGCGIEQVAVFVCQTLGIKYSAAETGGVKKKDIQAQCLNRFKGKREKLPLFT